MGAYYSTENFENCETGTNGTEISWQKFQKIRKLLHFRKANHSTENSGNSGMKVKWNGNFQEKILENLGIPHEVSSFSEFFSTQGYLVLLAAITASWTSHACKDDARSIKETL